MLRSSFATALFAAALALGTAAAPGSLGAQGPTALAPIPTSHAVAIAAPAPASGVATDTSAVRLAGPWAATAAFPVTLNATSDAAAYRDVGAGKNLALMGVGAAAIIIGLLVGDDAGTGIAIGGGLLGLYGFYQFLR